MEWVSVAQPGLERLRLLSRWSVVQIHPGTPNNKGLLCSIL